MQANGENLDKNLAASLSKGKSWRDFGDFTHGKPYIYGEMLKRFEYSVVQEEYDESLSMTLTREGFIEQGYALPHRSDHEWPERDWSDEKIVRLCGRVIPQSFSHFKNRT